MGSHDPAEDDPWEQYRDQWWMQWSNEDDVAGVLHRILDRLDTLGLKLSMKCDLNGAPPDGETDNLQKAVEFWSSDLLGVLVARGFGTPDWLERLVGTGATVYLAWYRGQLGRDDGATETR